MPHAHSSPASLYSRQGQRKYLSPDERRRFLRAAARLKRPELTTLCLVLAHTGCRISEALALTPAAISKGTIAVRSLKKRGGQVIYRELPVPSELTRILATVHRLDAGDPHRRLWRYSRSGAWRLIKTVMRSAGIASGPHATPKGLRHGFGLHAIRSGVPLHLVQKWLGHASLTTTAIYLQAVGAEEREFAERMWASC
ncbi:MAG: tyrosine-type recombinase/integrase [Hyphomicrobiaceae bacterium]|uniref:tyrosine-type recombinase/integrase n=1 Tax=Bradyrhizobium sp. TaxID=376 RepID=UPI003D1499B7